MRKRLTFLSLLTFLVAGPALAQARLSLEPRLGYGTFSMQPMKKLQDEQLKRHGVRSKATDRFPPFFQYGAQITYRFLADFRIGVVAEAGSTGGRVAYSDYSGSLRLDQLLRYKAAGIVLEREFFFRRLKYINGLEINALYSQIKLDSEEKILNQQSRLQEKAVAWGGGVKPYFGVVAPFKFLEGRLTVGYLLDKHQHFRSPDNPNLVLQLNNEKLGPDWSGLRLNLSIGLKLGQPEKSQELSRTAL